MRLRRQLKTVFPKPTIPQKRYLLLVCSLIYIALRAYSIHTPTTADDNLANDFISISQIGLSSRVNDGEYSEPSMPDDESYGEGDY